jgi:hypothetical protein
VHHAPRAEIEAHLYFGPAGQARGNRKRIGNLRDQRQAHPQPGAVDVRPHPVDVRAQPETVVGDPLLERIRERASRGPASFLIISPQSDPTQADHPEAERRLRRALTILRAEGIDVHGQVAHPDPYTAATHAVEDERVDEIIVSTFAPSKSPWLRRDLIQRLHKQTGLPVEHVVLQEEAEAASR